MKRKSELDLLVEENLDPRDLFILGFLKGFDRRKMKEWNKKGLFDFNLEQF